MNTFAIALIIAEMPFPIEENIEPMPRSRFVVSVMRSRRLEGPNIGNRPYDAEVGVIKQRMYIIAGKGIVNTLFMARDPYFANAPCIAHAFTYSGT